MIDAGVEARVAPSVVYEPVDSEIEARAGDGVRTDATGFAEIVYADGSLTRLDVDTDFEILTLADDETAAATTRLNAGRVWNRVEQAAGPDDAFEVDTPVASASVRGTAFVVSCATEKICIFAALEGTIVVTPRRGAAVTLEAPASLTVRASGISGDPVPLPFDAAFADPWFADNAARDAARGFADAAEMYEPYGPSAASLEGTFTGEREVTAWECLDGAPCEGESEVGGRAPRSYEFSVKCEPTALCVRQVRVEYTLGEDLLTKQVPLVAAAGGFVYSFVGSGPVCFFDGVGYGNYDITWNYTVEITAAEVRDGRWVATGLSVPAVIDNIANPQDPICAAQNYESSRVSSVFVANR